MGGSGQSEHQSGDKIAHVIYQIAQEKQVSKGLIRTRLIWLGSPAAKGAFNYVNGRYIANFAFDRESVSSGDTFVISRTQFLDLYEQKEVLTLGSISRYMVLRGESTPAVIPDEQMHRFKFMLDYSDETINMSTSPLSPGEKIKVIKGPLSGLQGELVTVNGKSKVAVRLTMLGCAFVDIPVGCVEPLEK